MCTFAEMAVGHSLAPTYTWREPSGCWQSKKLVMSLAFYWRRQLPAHPNTSHWSSEASTVLLPAAASSEFFSPACPQPTPF